MAHPKPKRNVNPTMTPTINVTIVTTGSRTRSAVLIATTGPWRLGVRTRADSKRSATASSSCHRRPLHRPPWPRRPSRQNPTLASPRRAREVQDTTTPDDICRHSPSTAEASEQTKRSCSASLDTIRHAKVSTLNQRVRVRAPLTYASCAQRTPPLSGGLAVSAGRGDGISISRPRSG